MSLVFLFCAVASLSAEQFGLFTYEVVGGSVTITDYPEDAVGEVEIPAEIDGNPVTSIGRSAFRDCDGLTDITLPPGVNSIGSSAFRDCDGLTDIILPPGLTSIGATAFSKCTGLTSVTIPEGVTSMGEYAFYDCTSLTSASIPEGVTAISKSMFQNCVSLYQRRPPARPHQHRRDRVLWMQRADGCNFLRRRSRIWGNPFSTGSSKLHHLLSQQQFWFHVTNNAWLPGNYGRCEALLSRSQ